MQYDYTDGDKLDCVKCDRFVSEIDDNNLCPTCAGEERSAEFLSCLGNGKGRITEEDENPESFEPIDFEGELKHHPKLEDCDDSECIYCGYRDCPHHEPLHYHHDGCPACIFDEEVFDWANVPANDTPINIVTGEVVK